MIDISNILGKKEGLHLEAKSARGGFPDSFWESYSAFANTDGGVILLGVKEKPDHSLYVTDGLTDAEKMKNDFWNMVNNRQKVSHNICYQQVEDVNDRTALKQLINDRLSKSPNINDKLSITTDVVDKLVDIVCYIRRYNHAKAGSISNYIGKSVSRTREYLQALIAIKMVLPEGGNKNRTYSVVVDNNVKL